MSSHSQDQSGQKAFSVRLAQGEGKCARVATGMLRILVGEENAEKLIHGYRSGDSQGA